MGAILRSLTQKARFVRGGLSGGDRADVSLILVSYVLGYGFQGALFVLISRVLGPTQFGIFAGAFAVASAFSTLSGIGGGNVLLMQASRDRAKFTTSLGTALVYVGLTVIPLFALAIPLVLGVSRDFLWCAVPLLVSELIGTRLTEISMLAFQAVDRLKVTAALNGAGGPLRFIAALVFWLSGGQSAYQWALLYAVANLALCVVSVVCMIRFIDRPSLSLPSLRTSWRIGTFFAMGNLSRIAYMDTDKYLLNRLGFVSEAGTYSAASRLVNFAFLPIHSLVYSKNAAMFRAGSRGYVESWKVVKTLVLPVVTYGAAAGGAIFAASPFVVWLLGTEYSATEDALRMISPLVILQGVGYLFGDALMGIGRQGLRSAFQLGVAVISVTSNLLLIPRLGWVGAAYSAVGSAAILAAVLVCSFVIGLRREVIAMRDDGTGSSRPECRLPP
jgi:O-antigen/teichoic acid export membrane protein